MKILIKFLALLLAFMMLAACGKGKEEKSSEQEKPQQTQTQTEQEKPEEKPEEKPVSIHKERVITVDGIKNVRDLGGLVTVDGKAIKKGIILRSSELGGTNANITDAGRQFLLSNYKIKTELDVRSDKEAEKNGAIPVVGELGPSVKYVHLSAKDYYEFTKGKTNEAEILSVFADFDNYPILYHCKYGADRTGTLTFILHALCGLDENFIALDYELTQWRQRSYEKYRELVESFKKIKGKTFQQKAYFLMKENFGLTLMQISNIYNIFMTDSAVFQSKALTTLHKTEFFLDLRGAKKVKEVLLDGKKTEFLFKENKLKLLTKNKDYKIGKILFNDGQVLWFE